MLQNVYYNIHKM